MPPNFRRVRRGAGDFGAALPTVTFAGSSHRQKVNSHTLAGGPAVIRADPRFAGFPLPLVVHIVSATTYALVGIVQFLLRFRRRHAAWHRRAGRVLAVAGLLVAISALWMTLFYEAQPGTGALLYLLRSPSRIVESNLARDCSPRCDGRQRRTARLPALDCLSAASPRAFSTQNALRDA
jgi:hypothetical protein